MKFLNAAAPCAAASDATIKSANATAAAERRTLADLPEVFQRVVESAVASDDHTSELQLFRHFDHRAAKAETRKQALRTFVLFGGPQDHAGRADAAKPFARGLDKCVGDATPLGFRSNDDVVNKAGDLSQFLPGLRLQACVDIPDDAAGSFRDEYADVGFLQLGA